MWNRPNYLALCLATLKVALLRAQGARPDLRGRITIYCTDDSDRKTRSVLDEHLTAPFCSATKLRVVYTKVRKKIDLNTYLFRSVVSMGRKFPGAWVINCESDHIYHPDFLIVAMETIKLLRRRRGWSLANLYNEQTSPHQDATYGTVKTRRNDYYKRTTCIGASLILAPDLLENLAELRAEIAPGFGWDWYFAALAEVSDRTILCSRRSWSQHLGLHGANNGGRALPLSGLYFED